jgi:hypothetical protein
LSAGSGSERGQTGLIMSTWSQQGLGPIALYIGKSNRLDNGLKSPLLTNRPEFGLIAEEVVEVNPDLVVHDESGEIYTVRYDAVNAMLLNEFLKEHKAFLEEQRKVQEQAATIARLKEDLQATAAQIGALTVGLQKVNAQIELSKPVPQTVLNNQ